MKLIQRLWNEERDISELEPVRWGIDNEDRAITDFEAQLESSNVLEKWLDADFLSIVLFHTLLLVQMDFLVTF